ncbi:MAG TPA: SRPBCC domain-containing protein [Bacteroidia bacterium]|nr:SRPBCC domain-containing protein [Bacteroidia bacterium]
MSNLLAFDFSIDKENKRITIKREFSADLSTVWNAFTKRELLDQWWAPKPWKAKTIAMNFKVGELWNYVMQGPEGEQHYCNFNYTKIENQKQFAGVAGFTDAEGNLNTAMPLPYWDINFIDKKKKTVVEVFISFDDLAQLETIINMGFKEGMTIAWQGLEEFLSVA